MTRLTLYCDISPETGRALETPSAQKVLKDFARKVDRRTRSRPGAAACEYEKTIDVGNGESLMIRLPAMRHGGSITIIHNLPGASLHSGRILKVRNVTLPETIMMGASGRRLGDLVSLEGESKLMAELSKAIITHIFEVDQNGQALLIHMDAPTIRPEIEIDN